MGDQLGQFLGTGHRLYAVSFNDGAGDAFGEALFTEGFQHPGNIVGFRFHQPFGGGLAA
ncbi:hypothetical protein D3C81_2297040 [compost metagenome]